MDGTGKRLHNLRKEFGYSFKDLEDLTGISRSTLQRYETIDSGKMPQSKIVAIAKAFNVSPSYLMGWESRDLRYCEYESIKKLLEESNYEIEYHDENETFTLNKTDGDSVYNITPSQIRQLTDKVLSYFKFELQQVIESSKID